MNAITDVLVADDSLQVVSAFCITRIVKTGGPLTKRIFLNEDGQVVSDGSACVMSRGRAQRMFLDGLAAFADLIHGLEPHEAIALGALRHDLPDQVDVVTQDQLSRLNGTATPNLIARTSSHISYQAGQSALALIDVDTKGMPPDVHARIMAAGGFWPALVSALPALATCGRVTRRSTSTGISRADTGEELPGSNGMHIFLRVQDGADVERFLRTLHERCWLTGVGWHMVGAGGQLLDRSLVDRMVYAPERLVFEGVPVLEPPLVQDAGGRKPQVFDGPPLDTVEACPPLRIVDTAELQRLKAQSAYALAPDRARARGHFISEHAGRLVERTGISQSEACRAIERQCEGVLLPDLILPWDSEEFAGCTVADVLADPARFVGATLADPLEGIAYGRTKAMVMRRPDGSPWIHSFAHGRTVYELRFDARGASAKLEAAPADQAADTFVQIATQADLAPDQMEALRNRAAEKAGVGRNAIKAKLKAARDAQDTARALEEHERQAAERRDPRPQIPAPMPDAPWLGQMDILNDVLGSSAAPEPPMRDIEGIITQVRVRRIPNMHALTSQGANGGETEATDLPAVEQPLLTRLDKTQLAELIERHIDHVDAEGRSVHLAAPFVEHFLTRHDDVLPLVAAIATLPLMLLGGMLLSRRGLDRQRGIVFRVPPHVLAAVPETKDCTPDVVAEAMQFLTDEWLCDVAADYIGKCILVAAALTIIERSVLPERPAFFVTAGRRGGGKTTALIMLLVAVTGIRPSAAAWSTNEEERRKALLSYFMEGPPAIIWDNIPRGTQIACPHIEKACTTAFYSDRRLGVSEQVSVAASTVQLFTGNNIRPRGDLASRSLQVRLEVDRPDPENRPFRHPDPIGWTEANRSRILSALYTLLIGNPDLTTGSNIRPKTRFKAWWRLVGSAIEHAVQQLGGSLDFAELFLSQENEEEENASLAEVLSALAEKWPQGANFQASEIAHLLNYQGEYQSLDDKERAAVLREFLFPKVPPNQNVSSKSVGKMMKRYLGEPVNVAGKTLVLKEWRPANAGPKGALAYYVQAS